MITSSKTRRPPPRWRIHRLAFGLVATAFGSAHAHASMLQGEALDTMADVISWIVLVVAPLVGIAVFWILHIMPEKIAEKKQHPQARAIQCLCILSLFFGGLLWPLAWLWTYTKPVFHKMAYGTDKVPHDEHEAPPSQPDPDGVNELDRLQQRVAELETRLADMGAEQKGEA